MQDVKVTEVAIQNKNRVQELLERPHVRGFLWGVGAAAVAAVVWPRVRHKVRPFVVNAVSGVVSLADDAMVAGSKIKEDLEDVVEEAKQKARHPEPQPAPPVTPGPGSTDMADLRASVSQMQSQMADMAELRLQMLEIRQLLKQAVGQEGN